jgi:hypothetical protein
MCPETSGTVYQGTTYSILKISINPETSSRSVKGHDFSRAERAVKGVGL